MVAWNRVSHNIDMTCSKLVGKVEELPIATLSLFSGAILVFKSYILPPVLGATLLAPGVEQQPCLSLPANSRQKTETILDFATCIV
jgi:hypothetical protein